MIIIMCLHKFLGRNDDRMRQYKYRRADDIRPYRSIFTLKLRWEHAPALRLDLYGLMSGYAWSIGVDHMKR